MIKILHTADWHIGQFNGPTVNGENARFLDICKCLDALVENAKKEKPDFIIFAGDMFHQARVWSDRGLKESQTAIGYIRVLEKIAPVVIVRGTPNHDSSEQFKMLETAFTDDDSVIICTKPEAIPVYSYGGKQITIAALPGFDRGYFRAKMPGLDKSEENEIFTQYIDTLIKGLKAQCADTIPSVLVTHYTVEGANMESGQTAFFSQFEPCVYLPTLNAAEFDISLFGHIHRPQQLSDCKNTFYCGAVSQLNFNDEGQQRGFYIHELEDNGKLLGSAFVELPTREFYTLHLQDKDIEDFNAGGTLSVDEEEISGKIIRVLYNCTDEHNKALNKTLMEQCLYEDGAFWVQEITPQKIEITVSKNALNEDDTPEENLKAYLAEHGFSDGDAGRITSRAIPIIHEALEKSLTLKKTGVFVPVETEVKNYRNYRDEKFNFDGIRFCTINGENGAGKSSLFMDAMCDCLFEETREGDISGWISNAEDARSGSIKFTFKMGEETYRVTRTRMKSGKATLNLAELVDGEWTDRSCEKMRDTQQEILNTIGMDSLTLKATALIMQDQYGLFLTADKDARMSILGNILGLSAYDDMYSRAFSRATETNREIRSLKDKTAILLDGVRDDKEIAAEIIEAQTALDGLTGVKKAAEERAASMQLALSVMEDAANRIVSLNAKIMTAKGKKAAAEASITTQQGIVMMADNTLSRRADIEAGVAEYKRELEHEKSLLEAKTKTEALTERVIAVGNEYDAAQEFLKQTERQKQTAIDTRLNPAKALLNEETELTKAHMQYEETKKQLAELEAVRTEYDAAMVVVREAQAAAEKARRDGEAGTNERNIRIAALRRRAELLETNNCQYAAEVQCSFLKDALEAKGQIDGALKDFDDYQSEMIDTVNAADKALLEAKAAVPDSYSPEKETALRSVLRGLEASERKYNDMSAARERLKAAEEVVAKYDMQIAEQKQRVKDILTDLKRIEAERDALCDAMAEYTAVVERIKVLAVYLEDEKKLPVAEEQKRTALARIEELRQSVVEYDQSIMEMEKERAAEQPKTMGSEILSKQYSEASTEVAKIDRDIQEVNRKIGLLERMKAEAEAKRKQAAALLKQTDDKSQEAADLEILKQAFSQDGIPHNIVRSIIPILEATATNILGQMSGGKMSVECVMEKTLKSNSKKEITALDIVINDSVTGRLPYLSRSGGERVKSALAFILALAEIKSTKAGVQLGFLFIDEPPFLDSQGMSAYCDALEAIQTRYSDLKVMAITHDAEMKSRFPQSVDIVKTAEGSKVIYA